MQGVTSPDGKGTNYRKISVETSLTPRFSIKCLCIGEAASAQRCWTSICTESNHVACRHPAFCILQLLSLQPQIPVSRCMVMRLLLILPVTRPLHQLISETRP